MNTFDISNENKHILDMFIIYKKQKLLNHHSFQKYLNDFEKFDKHFEMFICVY